MNKILVLINFAENNEALLSHAEVLGKAMQGKLWIVHIANPDPDFVGYDVGSKEVRNQVAKEFRQEHKKLHEIAESFRSKGLDATALLIQGPIIEKIIEETERLDINLIVAELHEHAGLYKIFNSSVVDQIIANASCAVYLVPSNIKNSIYAV